MTARTGCSSINGFRQLAAGGTNEHVFRMAGVSGEQITRKQIDIMLALAALCQLHPKEILDVGVFSSTVDTLRSVKVSQFLRQGLSYRISGVGVAIDIEMVDFLFHDPVGHRIDIKPNHIASEAICLEQRCATPHKGICNFLIRKLVCPKKRLTQRIA